MNPEDLKIEYWPPRDKGGQQVGYISKGVKVTHAPTGLVAICDCARSQLKNKNIATQMIEYGLSFLKEQ